MTPRDCAPPRIACTPAGITLALLALATVGCDAFFNEVFVEPTPERDLRGRSVLIVPFAEGDSGWYGDTAHGAEFSHGLAQIIHRECSRTTIPSTPAAVAALDGIISCVDDEVPWGRFGEEAGVDLIVFGRITSMVFEKPQLIGMLQGELSLTVNLFDVAENRIVWQSGRLEYVFPENPETGKVVASMSSDSSTEVRHALFGLAAKDLMKLFCGGYERVTSREER